MTKKRGGIFKVWCFIGISTVIVFGLMAVMGIGYVGGGGRISASSFTDADSPFVVFHSPEGGAIDVPIDISVTATFSTDMDPSTINKDTFQLIRGGIESPVPGRVTYKNRTASLKPGKYYKNKKLLYPGSSYHVIITTGVKDINGNSMASDRRWGFLTTTEGCLKHLDDREFLANTHVAGMQFNPDVEIDSSGNFVIVWYSNQNGGEWDIYARRYNAAGEAQGKEFRVNTYTESHQWHPSIAMDTAGNFVVVWTSKHQDGDEYGVYARRYNAAGKAQGKEFRVNTYTKLNQWDPWVAMDAEGSFVVVWLSQDKPGIEKYWLYGKRFNAAGKAQGKEFLISPNLILYDKTPDDESEMPWEESHFGQWIVIAMSHYGDFVVVWQNDLTRYPSYADIYARCYNSLGVAQGSEFLVNTKTKNAQIFPDVAMDANGNFVVVWYPLYEKKEKNVSVFARLFAAGGIPQGDEFQVDSHPNYDAHHPAVAMDANGNFLVGWESDGRDGDKTGIFGRRFNAAGELQVDDFPVNNYWCGPQEGVHIAMISDSEFIYVFGADDGDGDAVGVRRYVKPEAKYFKINTNGNETANQIIILNNTCSVYPTGYIAAEDLKFTKNVQSEDYSPFPGYQLSSGYGKKTVFFKVKNEAGWSNIRKASIIYKKPQQGKPGIKYFGIKNGATYTTKRKVTLNSICTGNPTHYRASETEFKSEADILSTEWKKYKKAPVLKMSANKGMKTVYFQVKNAKGESGIVLDQIHLGKLSNNQRE